MGGSITDDDSSPVILNGAGKNFTRTRTELTRHDDQGPIPDHAGFEIIVVLHTIIRIFDLNDRSFVDEQSGEINRLGETSSAVASQIQNNRIDPVFLKIFQDSSYVTSRTFVIGNSLASRVHIHVEAWQVDDTDFIFRAICFFTRCDNFAASFAVLQFDLCSRDVIDFRVIAIGGFHTKSHDRTGLATNQLDHIIQVHVDHIDHLAIRTLPDTHDTVFGL